MGLVWVQVLVSLFYFAGVTALTVPPTACPLGLAVPALVVPPVLPDPGVSDPVWVALVASSGPLFAASLYAGNVVQELPAPWIASFDALAPYSDHAGFIIGNKFKRPASERTLANKKTAVYYAVYHTMIGAYGPECLKAAYDQVFASAGFDPAASDTELSSPIGLGRAVAAQVVHFLKTDGFNLDGNLPDVTYGRTHFSDYTHFVPANTAYEFKYPTKWQPQRVVVGYGVTLIQEYTGAQAGRGKTLSFKHPKDLNMPPPYASVHFPSKAYKKQADRMVNLSAGLTDYQKILAEFADSPVNVLQGAMTLVNRYKLSFEQHVVLMGAIGCGIRDVAIAILYFKSVFNTPRPFSVIRSSGIYKDKIRAWGGPYKGTVLMHPQEWRQYMTFTAPEPEYPSGGSSFGGLMEALLSRFFNTSRFDYYPTVAAGGSIIEPGLTPTSDVTLQFGTFENYRKQALLGRELSGNHFYEATIAGGLLGLDVGKKVWEKVQCLLKGKA